MLLFGAVFSTPFVKISMAWWGLVVQADRSSSVSFFIFMTRQPGAYTLTVAHHFKILCVIGAGAPTVWSSVHPTTRSDLRVMDTQPPGVISVWWTPNHQEWSLCGHPTTRSDLCVSHSSDWHPTTRSDPTMEVDTQPPGVTPLWRWTPNHQEWSHYGGGHLTTRSDPTMEVDT